MTGFIENSPRFVALTGTPGTGKTVLSKAIVETFQRERRWGPLKIREVGDLAIDLGTGKRLSGKRTVEVNLRALSSALRKGRRDIEPHDIVRASTLVIVGHLAHLLPVEATVLLRCHPTELERRLRQRGDSEKVISENVEAELVDVILFEALKSGLPLYEHDTTSESPEETARWLERVLLGKVRPRHGFVDWLRNGIMCSNGTRVPRRFYGGASGRRPLRC